MERITTIDVVLSKTDIIYAGTASGGVWKSSSAGVKWDPIFDDQVTASIGSIAIQQSNPDVIWVGTGEGNPRNSLNGGYGIFKSIDGGKTWKSMGLEKTRHIEKVIINPTNPDIVYIWCNRVSLGNTPKEEFIKQQTEVNHGLKFYSLITRLELRISLWIQKTQIS